MPMAKKKALKKTKASAKAPVKWKQASVKGHPGTEFRLNDGAFRAVVMWVPHGLPGEGFWSATVYLPPLLDKTVFREPGDSGKKKAKAWCRDAIRSARAFIEEQER